MTTLEDIFAAYLLASGGTIKIVPGALTDQEAQECIRGIGASQADLETWARADVERLHPSIIKAEVNTRSAYLIYLK